MSCHQITGGERTYLWRLERRSLVGHALPPRTTGWAERLVNLWCGSCDTRRISCDVSASSCGAGSECGCSRNKEWDYRGRGYVLHAPAKRVEPDLDPLLRCCQVDLPSSPSGLVTTGGIRSLLQVMFTDRHMRRVDIFTRRLHSSCKTECFTSRGGDLLQLSTTTAVPLHGR